MNEELALAFFVWTLSSSSLGTVFFRCLLHYHRGESSVYILLAQRMKVQIPWQKHRARGSNNPEITGPASGDGHVDLAAQFLQKR